MPLTNLKGIFALSEVSEKIANETWASDGLGYFTSAPGVPGPNGPSSRVDRLDFSSDTLGTLPRGTFDAAGAEMAHVGTNNSGYYNYGAIYRMDYNNDTNGIVTRFSGGPQHTDNIAKAYAQATGTGNFGWFAGGINGPTSRTYIERADYKSDLLGSSFRAYLNSSHYYKAGTGNQNYGWYGGQNMNRLDYSNDTTNTSPRGNLNIDRWYLSATGTADYGWYVGGANQPSTVYYTSIDRVDYSNDTVTASPRGPLSVARRFHATTGNFTEAYAAGGDIGGGSYSSIEKISFSNDTATASPRSNLIFSRSYSKGTSTNNIHGGFAIKQRIDSVKNFGYVVGGLSVPAGNVSGDNERINFDSDTAILQSRGGLNVPRYAIAATGNINYGYFGGGYDTQFRGTIERLDYSNDSQNASFRNALTTGKVFMGGHSNRDYGYFTGGYTYVAPGLTLSVDSSVERFSFSNDTAVTSTRGPLNRSGYNQGVSGNINYAWISGGSNGNPTNNYWPNYSNRSRIDYSNDTATSTPRGNLDTNYFQIPTTGTYDFGWYIGGYVFTPAAPTPNFTTHTKVMRISYSNDTVTTPTRTNIPTPNNFVYRMATGSRDYGYVFGGGIGPTNPSLPIPGGSNGYSGILRLDYSNDDIIPTVRNSLNGPRTMGAGVSPVEHSCIDPTFAKFVVEQPPSGTESYSWYVGGGHTSVERFDFSNDLNKASVRGPLYISPTVSYQATVGNANYSWQLGGSPARTIVERVSFANDTSLSSTRGPLTKQKYGARGVGNSNYGYMGGGFDINSTPGPVGARVVSEIERIEYANDLAAGLVRSSLTEKRHYLAAMGSPNYGYFMGGEYEQPSPAPPPAFSIVDRLDYANDTVTTSPRGPLNTIRSRGAGLESQNYGYYIGGTRWDFGGGGNPERIDFSNDLITPDIRGGSPGWHEIACSGNANYGYQFGGASTTYVFRMDFNNDTLGMVSRGNLVNARNWGGSSSASYLPLTPGPVPPEPSPIPSPGGTTQFGYFGGGESIPSFPGGNVYSGIDRLDFVNDTSVNLRRSNLTIGRYYTAATGNTNYTWFGGGYWQYYSGSWITNWYTRVDRLDYSNDTTNAIARGPLTTARGFLTGSGNTDYGWYYGGQGPAGGFLSNIDRITYASDGSTASPRGPLTYAAHALAATGNANYGYIFGGYFPSVSNYVSNTARLDYANDTSGSSARGSSNYPRGYHQAVGSKDYGWFSGGNSPGPFGGVGTLVERVDYANDTVAASPRGSLLDGIAGRAAVGNADYGWIGGGRINRIDYNNDTAIASPRATYFDSRSGESGSSGSHGGIPTIPAPPAPAPFSAADYGYFGGGTAPGWFSTVERFDYTSDTSSTSTRTSLTVAKAYLSATSNSSYAWFGGGYNPVQYSDVDRVDYSNDTSVSIRGSLTTAKYGMSAIGNENYGYFVGGASPVISTIDRIDYSNDTVAATAINTTLASPGVYYSAAAGNLNYGWIGGGYNGSSNLSSVQRIDYASDTSALSARGVLVLARNALCATGTQHIGYFMAGGTTVDRVEYANDTVTASPRGLLTLSRGAVAAIGNNSYAYIAGNGSITERVDYSNDTATTAVRGGIYSESTNRAWIAGATAAANGLVPSTAPSPSPTPPATNFGYSGAGGSFPGTTTYSALDRLDFANDTSIAQFRYPLSLNRSQLASSANTSYAYFGGGHDSSLSVISTFERLTYADDLSAPSPKANLSIARRDLSAVGNANYGWFAGGNTPAVYSVVDRIDYASDTTDASPRGPLLIERYGLSAAGNANYGWFAGGLNTPGVAINLIERITYASDTTATVSRAPLSFNRNKLASVGNSNYGWFGGGDVPATAPATPVAYSIIDRVDYSNDTVTASPRGPLSIARRGLSATGNANYGYFISGISDTPAPSPTFYTTIDRVDYSNDTASASPRGGSSGAYYGRTANSPTAHGLS